MKVCAGCRVELRCQKNGVVVRTRSTGYCLRGDVFECPACGARTIITARGGYTEDVTLVGEIYYDLQERGT
jgi:hypothetical protein